MSTWNQCSTDNLYSHATHGKTVFLYTKKGMPASLAQCFERGGFTLVFCRDEIEDLDGEKQLIRAIASVHDDDNGRLVFFKNEYDYTAARFSKFGSEGRFRLEYGLLLPLENYGIEVDAHSVIKVSQNSGAECIAFDGSFVFYLSDRFYHFGKALRLYMDGGGTGCFSFSLNRLKSLWDIGADLCYTAERNYPIHGHFIDEVHSVPFEPHTNISVPEARIDVLRPFDYQRTFFSLPAGGYDTGFAVAFDDNLRLELKENGGARLVFARQRLFRNNNEARLYLCPMGDFDIISGDGDLLAGTSGTEYIKFKTGARLTFLPGKKAHFYISDDEKTDEPVGETAYIYVEGTYYSQGQNGAFFAKTDNVHNLDFAEIPFGPMDENRPLPIMPLGFSEKNPSEDYGILTGFFDTGFLAHERNRIVKAPETVSFSAVPVQAISEKGIYITYVPNSDYFSTLEISDKFRFANVKGRLRRALLSSRPFLVICGKNPIADEADYITEQYPLNIDGWVFDFDPSKWTDNTMLILKYTDHKSIAEYADYTEEWSYPTDAEKIENAQNNLKKILPKSVKIGTLSEFASNTESTDEFLDYILTDKNFCGAVLINMPIEADCLPSEIRFLATAGNPVSLFLNYMVFDSRNIDENGDLRPSSVSAAIIHEDYNYSAPADIYKFLYRLNRLSVTFRNSHLTAFDCELSLAFNYLMGSPVYALDSKTGNFIPVKGCMTNEVDSGGVVRYYFELKNEILYSVSGSAVEDMRITAVTLLAAAQTGGMSFFFSGGFGFCKYESDIFSYGEEDPDAKDRVSWLMFTNFEVACQGQRYSDSIGGILFMPDESTARNGSFAESFKVTVERFIYTDTNTPQDIGFEGINVDGITQVELGDCWSGLVTEVNLGGLGALAEAMEIKLKLLLAWAAGENKNEYDGSVSTQPPGLYIGLRLGDFLALPLEGVMSLGFEAIELKKDGNTGEFYFLMKDFLLKLLKLQFPPGSSKIYIFGNKDDADKLAWYGAYER